MDTNQGNREVPIAGAGPTGLIDAMQVLAPGDGRDGNYSMLRIGYFEIARTKSKN
ncbi:hypothetical protein ACWCPQ_29385 [Nocardia sp. NPDC001965]